MAQNSERDLKVERFDLSYDNKIQSSPWVSLEKINQYFLLDLEEIKQRLEKTGGTCSDTEFAEMTKRFKINQ